MKEFMQTTTSYSTNLSPIEGYETRVKQFTGHYESTRVPYSTPDKLYYEMYADQSFELTANDQGQLIFFGMTFLEIEENLFQDTRGYGVKLFFADNEQGQTKYLYINDVSVTAYEKLNWYEYSSFQLFLIIFISSIFGLSLLFWIVEGIVKFVRKKKQKDPTPVKTTTTTDIQLSNVFKEKTKAKWVINWPRIIVLGQVILSGALVIVVDIFHVLRFDYSLPYDDFFDRILIMPFFILLFVAATTINSILEWGGKNYQRTADQPLKIWEKIHFSIVALTGVAWIWLINYWNFLGYKSGGIM